MTRIMFGPLPTLGEAQGKLLVPCFGIARCGYLGSAPEIFRSEPGASFQVCHVSVRGPSPWDMPSGTAGIKSRAWDASVIVCEWFYQQHHISHPLLLCKCSLNCVVSNDLAVLFHHSLPAMNLNYHSVSLYAISLFNVSGSFLIFSLFHLCV